MSVTCPEGHLSEATDYCDTCGTPIGAGASGGAGTPGGSGAPGGLSVGGGAGMPSAGPALPDPSFPGSVLDLDPAAQAATQTCPHCGATNVADALFCEACGYDFTTGAAPLDDEPGAQPAQDEPAEPAEPAELDEPDEPDEPAVAQPLVVDAPDAEAESEEPGAESGEPDTAAESAEPDAAAAPDEPDAELDGPDEGTPEPELPVEPEPAESHPEASAPAGDDIPEPSSPPPGPPPAAAHARPRHTPPSRDLADAWVVEVWVDPDWYAVQQTDEACPSAGVPDIVVVRRNVVLVGRPSGSRGVRPDVDAGGDSAVSRRHAQLTSDGRRWWIEDLGSSNGTFVGVVGEPLPTKAITPGQRVEIDRDDRIYVGAWTRIVLRQATASEQAGQG